MDGDAGNTDEAIRRARVLLDEIPEMQDMAYSDRSLAIACTRGREAIVSRFQSLLVEQGLTEAQWRVLRVLTDYSPLSLTDLCRSSCIHKVSMTRIIRALISKGLVDRVRQTSDRRAYDVSLSAAGSTLMAGMTPKANRVYADIIADFGRADARLLLALLRRLSRLNDKRAPEPEAQISPE